MKYKVRHTTTYNYDHTVPVCQNLAYLSPRATPYQSCSYHRLDLKPPPATSGRRIDYFGNAATYFTITKGHHQLNTTAISNVEVLPREIPEAASSPAWEPVRDALPADNTHPGLDNFQFCFESPHVPRLDELAEYAGQEFAAGRPILEALSHLTARIHADFTYDPLATTVSTPIDEVFRQRSGVCQDLAHLQIGCLRALGLAARYVSGYVRTVPPAGKSRLVGADASHAWLAVFCGRLGWIDVDPTNNTFVSTDHITLAWGRDYSDICPVSGMFIGGGSHTMKVAVDVVQVSGDREAG